MAFLALTLVALVYCLSGSALTVLNKKIMSYLPTPNFVLFAQNAVALFLLLLGKIFFGLEVDTIRKRKALRWFPLVLLFYAMLASSLLALTKVTATTLIVQRNLCTVTIAFADYFYLGTVQTKRRIVSIFGMCLGSVLYTWSDIVTSATFDFVGYAWLAVNIAATTAYQIKVKSLVNELGMNSWTMSHYNNLLSLPVCVITAVLQGEAPMFRDFVSSGLMTHQTVSLFVSCTLGFCLSVSAFQLNRLTSATSITILNNTNKFMLIFFTAYFMDYTTLTVSSVMGAATVMACAAYYSSDGLKK